MFFCHFKPRTWLHAFFPLFLSFQPTVTRFADACCGVAPAPIRGPALMTFQFMQSLAQFAVAGITQGTESIDSAASYHIPMGLLIVLPALMLILLPFTPESPVWYVYKDKHEQAEQALRKINRSTPGYDPSHDLQTIDDQVKMEKEMEAESSCASLFQDPVERRKLIFSCGAMFAQQINGIQFWYTYGVVFAESIGVAQPFAINTITDILQIIVVGASVILGNKTRRGTNLLVCTLGIFFSLIAVGGLGTTHRGGPFSKGVGTAIVVFAYINIICFNFSIGTYSYMIASEMAVGRNRIKITACAICVFFFTVWLMVFVSPYLYTLPILGPCWASYMRGQHSSRWPMSGSVLERRRDVRTQILIGCLWRECL